VRQKKIHQKNYYESVCNFQQVADKKAQTEKNSAMGNANATIWGGKKRWGQAFRVKIIPQKVLLVGVEGGSTAGT